MAGTTDITGDSVREHRMEVFAGLGFSQAQSKRLTEAKDDDGWPLDTQHVKRMLSEGCTHRLVLKIVL